MHKGFRRERIFQAEVDILFLCLTVGHISNCSTYLTPYIEGLGDHLIPDTMRSTTECAFCCSSGETNNLLKSVSSEYEVWRMSFGILLVYAIFGADVSRGSISLLGCQRERRRENNDFF